jgi:hypothetical protein
MAPSSNWKRHPEFKASCATPVISKARADGWEEGCGGYAIKMDSWRFPSALLMAMLPYPGTSPAWP